MLPKVSIIMPSLNVAPYIQKCMESVLAQKETDIEIICIDAGSTDGTREILEKYVTLDSRIRLFHSEVKSYGAQVNQGIKAAKGKYIAILETDDYVDEDMYGILYTVAEENQIDFIKADYDTFYTLQNGSLIIKTVKLWNGTKNYYNKIICPKECNYLYTHDFNVWKGIYRKKFLIENSIWFNETPGAAFQDIGFRQKVFDYARKAYYLDRSFYRYRLDREESSTYSIKCLRFAYQEFYKLLQESIAPEKGLFLHMAISFFFEYKKTLNEKENFSENEEYGNYVKWFYKTLKHAHENNLLPLNELDYEQRKKIEQLLFEPSKFVDDIMTIKRNGYLSKLMNNIINQPYKRPLIIYGAGGYGVKLYKLLDKNSIDILAFADSNKDLEGTIIGEKKVLELKVALDEYKDAFFVISSERNLQSMKDSILLLGGSEEKIIYA